MGRSSETTTKRRRKAKTVRAGSHGAGARSTATTKVTTGRRPKVTTSIINKNPPEYFDQPKPRQLKSCSRCRKHKTKCNYVDTAPNPCTSCAKRGLTCHLEIVIPVKRSNIIKHLTRDVDELKSLVHEMVTKEKQLKQLCAQRHISVEGLVEVDDEFGSAIHNSYYCGECSGECDIVSGSTDDDEEHEEDVEFEQETEAEAEPEVDAETEVGSRAQSECGSMRPAAVKSNDTEAEEEEEECNSAFSEAAEILTPNSDLLDSSNFSEYGDFCPKSRDTVSVSDAIPRFPVKNPRCAGPLQFTLNDLCTYTYEEVAGFFDRFNDRYAEFVPVLDKYGESPVSLYSSSRLLFWTIVYVVTNNPQIEVDFLDAELERQTSDTLRLVQSIVLIAAFPTKSLQWDEEVTLRRLHLARKLLPTITKHRQQLAYMVFNLGTIYSFRLGSHWDGPVPRCHVGGKYLNSLSAKVALLSEVMNETRQREGSRGGSEAHLTEWTARLKTLKHDKVFEPLVGLVLVLVNPAQNSHERIAANTRIFNACRTLWEGIQQFEITCSPIYVKTALEFGCLVCLKLIFSPFNGGNPDINLFAEMFTALSKLGDYKHSKQILDAFIELDANFKMDAGIIEFGKMSSFNKHYMRGLLDDVKSITTTLKGSQIIEDSLVLQEYFVDNSLDFDSYKISCRRFKERADLVSIYSTSLLDMEGWTTEGKAMDLNSLPDLIEPFSTATNATTFGSLIEMI